MTNREFEQLLEERNKVAISGKYEDYVKYCKKYKCPIAPNNKVFEIMIHKIRANITKGIPKEMQEESKQWLINHGYKLF